MARSNEKVTPQEFKTFEEYFAKNPQFDTAKNGDEFADYLVNLWNVDITDANLAIAAQRLTEAGRLEVLNPVQVRYLQISRQDPNAAQLVSDWYTRQNFLVKDDQDKALENQTALLLELRGRETTPTNIQLAMGRVGHRNGLHYAPAPHRADPRQHEESGSFMPKNETNRRYVGGRKNHGQSAKPEDVSTPAPTSPNLDVFETACRNMLAHGTHGCQSAMRELYERRGSKSWRELHREMTEVKRSYERLVRY